MRLEEYFNMLEKYGIVGVNVTGNFNLNEKEEEEMELKNLIRDLNSVITDILKSEKTDKEKLDRISAVNEVIELLLK